MKKDIKWHKECQKNSQRYYERLLEHALTELEKAKEGLKKAKFYKYQIEEAEKQNKDSFDRDKFKKTRKK